MAKSVKKYMSFKRTRKTARNALERVNEMKRRETVHAPLREGRVVRLRVSPKLAKQIHEAHLNWTMDLGGSREKLDTLIKKAKHRMVLERVGGAFIPNRYGRTRFLNILEALPDQVDRHHVERQLDHLVKKGELDVKGKKKILGEYDKGFGAIKEFEGEWMGKLEEEERLKLSSKVGVLIRTDPKLKHLLGRSDLREFYEEQARKNARKRHFMEKADLAAYFGLMAGAEAGGMAMERLGVLAVRTLRLGEEVGMGFRAASQALAHLSAHPTGELAEEELEKVMKKRERKNLRKALLNWDKKKR